MKVQKISKNLKQMGESGPINVQESAHASNDLARESIDRNNNPIFNVQIRSSMDQYPVRLDQGGDRENIGDPNCYMESRLGD